MLKRYQVHYAAGRVTVPCHNATKNVMELNFLKYYV